MAKKKADPDLVRPKWGIGSVLLWMDSPVLVLEDPVFKPNGAGIAQSGWYARSAYLDVKQARINYRVGEIVEFNVGGNKDGWRDPLTDEQEVLAARLLLDV
jgi:hypothetical protein